MTGLEISWGAGGGEGRMWRCRDRQMGDYLGMDVISKVIVRTVVLNQDDFALQGTCGNV